MGFAAPAGGATASTAPGMAAVAGVERAVEIEQKGGGRDRWHGCRVRPLPVIVHRHSPRDPYAGLHAPRARRAAGPPGRPLSVRRRRDAASTKPTRLHPGRQRHHRGAGETREQGKEAFVFAAVGRGPAARAPGGCGAHVLRGDPGLQLAAVSSPPVPGRQRGRGAVSDHSRLQPVSPGRRRRRTGCPRGMRSTSWPFCTISAPSRSRAARPTDSSLLQDRLQPDPGPRNRPRDDGAARRRVGAPALALEITSRSPR